MNLITTVPVVPHEIAGPPPGDDSLYEVINGQRVELPPMSMYAVAVANWLAGFLNEFARPRGLGRAFVEGLFRLPLDGGRSRRPDVAFVTAQRWAMGRPIPESDNAWDVVPDLAFEVVSPTDRAEDLMEKVEEYFQAGVRLVWVVYPRRRRVHVYESLSQIRGLAGAEELGGGAVLPEFRLPLTALFQEPASPI